MNDAQRAAVMANIAVPLLIVAGAGSGKTLTMVRRIEHIIKISGCRPREVLAITFTRNACDEMKARLRRLLGYTVATSVVVLTIHSFCLRVLRRHLQDLDGSMAGFSNDFTIASKREQVLMIEEACDAYDVSQSRPPAEDPKARSSRAKRLLTKVLQLRAKGTKAQEPTNGGGGGELLYCCEYYARTLQESATLDFHDLVEKTTLLLETVPSAAATIRRMHRYVLVDEFQDVSTPQFSLLKALAGPDNGTVTAVGDDDQSIYSFQGACVGNFQNFERHFQSRHCATIRLEQNYRSSGIIVAAANSVIDKNTNRMSKKLFTDKESGEKVKICECRHAGCEIAFVLNELQRRHSPPATARSDKQGEAKAVPWHQMAILYRTNAVGATFQEALRKAAIPFTVSGEHLYSPLEVDDVLSLLRFAIHGHNDNQALVRVAKILRAPLPSEVYNALKNHADAQRVSMLHACRWFLRHKGQVGNVCPVSGKKSGSKSTAPKKRGKSPTVEVKKVVDFYDTIRLRLVELSLSSLIRRLVDFHPWVKQRMQRQQQQQQPAPNSSSSVPSSLSSSNSSSSSGNSSSTSSSQMVYGDLGSALIREAEIFDATYLDEEDEEEDEELRAPFSKRRRRKKSNSITNKEEEEEEEEDPERAWREATGEGRGEDEEDEEDESNVQEFEEDHRGVDEDPAVLKRARKAKAFLDHLIVAAAEDAPIGGDNNQTGNENRHVVTASGKVLKRGNGTNSGSTTNKPTTTAAAEEPPVRDAVFMGTVHQAKGLEWPVVLVVRFNEEEFPLAPRIDSDESSDTPASSSHKSHSAAFETAFEEEERRLAYVALSRPQHALIVSYVIQDQSSGGSAPPPSRFLKDIPPDLTTRSECFSDLAVAAAGGGAAGNTYAATMAGAVADAKNDSSPGGSSFRTFTAAATSSSLSSLSLSLSSSSHSSLPSSLSSSSSFPVKKASKIATPRPPSSSAQPWASFVRNPSKQPVHASSTSSIALKPAPAPVPPSAYLLPASSHHQRDASNSVTSHNSSSFSHRVDTKNSSSRRKNTSVPGESNSVQQQVNSVPPRGITSLLKPPQQPPTLEQATQATQQQQQQQPQRPLTAQQLLAQRKRTEFLQAREKRQQQQALSQQHEQKQQQQQQVQPLPQAQVQSQLQQEQHLKQQQCQEKQEPQQSSSTTSSRGSGSDGKNYVNSSSSSNGSSSVPRRSSSGGSSISSGGGIIGNSCSTSERTCAVQNVRAKPEIDEDVATLMAWEALPVLGDASLAPASSSNAPDFSDD